MTTTNKDQTGTDLDKLRESAEYGRVKEEFRLASSMGAKFCIPSAMLNVDTLLATALSRRAQPAGAGELADEQSFAAWLAREIPPGTIINDPAWWAPRILRAALTYPSVSASPEQGEDEESAEDEWRRLALQFDGHRMQALCHLRAMLQDPVKHAPVATAFLNAPPLSGEEVLAQRITALTQQPSAAPSVQPAGAPAKAQPDLPYVEGWSLPRDLATAHKEIQKLRIAYAEAVAALSASPSAPAVQAEPVYQAHMGNGNWIDVEHRNLADLQRRHFEVRTLYTGAAPTSQTVDGEALRKLDMIDYSKGVICTNGTAYVALRPHIAEAIKNSTHSIAQADDPCDGCEGICASCPYDEIREAEAAQTTTASASGDVRAEFEAWAKSHGGLPLDRAGDHLKTDDGLLHFPTYKFGRTEIAWRAWANRRAPAPSRSAAPADGEDARDAVLEEAATVCACLVKNRRAVYARDCVDAIRALKSDRAALSTMQQSTDAGGAE